MTNQERILIKIKSINPSPNEVSVYSAESGLNANDTYNPSEKAQTCQGQKKVSDHL
ncbi:hypothetical protein ACQCN2_03600 [Brevibacillus ginsengisoli]|uniref:hypothetical protein n=1 Tax=Brevibacillus ginsengisoli TaxID=363854 RepID=UPI003CE839C8